MSQVTMARRGMAALVSLLFLSPAALAAQTDDLAPDEAEKRAFAAKDPVEKTRYLEIAAKGGRRDAQMILGERYLRGSEVPKDVERAIELLKSSAIQGSARAQSLLGWAYSGGGAKSDPVEALKWFVAAGRQEEGYALMRLSEFYYRGIAVARDETRAKRLLLRAAELADPTAVRAAWGVLLVGPPADRDARLGMHFLTKAANMDDTPSAYALGREYLTGRDVPHDPLQAAYWLTRASKANYAPALLWMSELHAKGVGVPRNTSRAQDILQTALRTATLSEKNQFSWTLAVDPDARLRNAALAIRVLEPALAAEKQKSPAHLDTLAAAYAEHGQFDKAVATQVEAIETLRRTRPNDQSPGMEQRLDLYRAGKAYREEML